VPLLRADPGRACAGAARRAILPLASPRSVFGADEPGHASAREPIAELFAAEAVQRHGEAMAAIAERHADAWPTERPFPLLDRMRALAAEVFVRLVLAVDDDVRAGAIVDALRRMLGTPGNPPLGVPGEGDGLIGSVARRVLDRRHAPLTALLVTEVERRRGDPPNDLLGRLLRADPRRSGTDIADEVLVLLAAAQEPMAVACTRVLDRLGRSPGLEEAFAAPARRAAIVHETLRLDPPVLAGLRRLAEARDVAGHRLPAGAVVMVPIPLVHRDPRAFPRPDAFEPERWTGGTESYGPYLPFGAGLRRCLGEHLARAEIDSVIPAILRRVRLRPVRARPERTVLRGTILVPHRGGPTAATLRERPIPSEDV
jgi:cytochrome P450 family 135